MWYLELFLYPIQNAEFCSGNRVFISGKEMKFKLLSEKKFQLNLQAYNRYYDLSIKLQNDNTVDLLPSLS